MEVLVQAPLTEFGRGDPKTTLPVQNLAAPQSTQKSYSIGFQLAKARTEIFNLTLAEFSKASRISIELLQALESDKHSYELLLKNLYLVFEAWDSLTKQSWSASKRTLPNNCKQFILNRLTHPWKNRSQEVVMRWCYLVGVDNFCKAINISRDKLLTIRKQATGIPYETLLEWGKTINLIPKNLKDANRYWNHEWVKKIREASYYDAKVCKRPLSIAQLRILFAESKRPFTKENLSKLISGHDADQLATKLVNWHTIPPENINNFYLRLKSIKHIPYTFVDDIKKQYKNDHSNKTSNQTWAELVKDKIDKIGLTEQKLAQILRLYTETEPDLQNIFKEGLISQDAAAGIISIIVANSEEELKLLLSCWRTQYDQNYLIKFSKRPAAIARECRLWGIKYDQLPLVEQTKALSNLVEEKVVACLSQLCQHFELSQSSDAASSRETLQTLLSKKFTLDLSKYNNTKVNKNVPDKSIAVPQVVAASLPKDRIFKHSINVPEAFLIPNKDTLIRSSLAFAFLPSKKIRKEVLSAAKTLSRGESKNPNLPVFSQITSRLSTRSLEIDDLVELLGFTLNSSIPEMRKLSVPEYYLAESEKVLKYLTNQIAKNVLETYDLLCILISEQDRTIKKQNSSILKQSSLQVCDSILGITIDQIMTLFYR